jgi:acetyltransferase-like isoleucine patch superfamily enzyme
MTMQEPPSEIAYLTAPREGVNDDVVRLVEWCVADGAQVAMNQTVAMIETTKATVDVVADHAGYLFRLADAGSEVPVGGPLAVISSRPERPAKSASAKPSPVASGQVVVTAKARPLLEQHHLTLDDFPGLSVIRAEDVQRLIAQRAAPEAASAPRWFGGELLDPAMDWDEVLNRADAQQLAGLLAALRRRMKARFDRHVPLGSLLHDRWQLARDLGFGEGTSVYDECLVLGNVKVGKHCWVGPYTVLDGQGGLSIGDYVDIGTGAHIYSHNTIERALTGHKAQLFRGSTAIGNCCFIAPHAIIGPETTIGDHSFVAAGSYVEGKFPAYSYIAGCPATQVGEVVVRGDRAHRKLWQRKPGEPRPAGCATEASHS